jgi:hypothetical protein
MFHISFPAEDASYPYWLPQRNHPDRLIGGSKRRIKSRLGGWFMGQFPIYIYLRACIIIWYIYIYIHSYIYYIYRFIYIGIDILVYIYIDIILLVQSLSFPVTLSIYLSIRKCPMVFRSTSQFWTNWDIFFWCRGIAVSWTVRSAAPAPCATMDGLGNANVPVTSGAVQHPQERRWMYYGSWGIQWNAKVVPKIWKSS